jgi:hypothetical protein
VKRGHTSAFARESCAVFLLALDYARLAIAMPRRRRRSDAEHSEKTRMPLSHRHPSVGLAKALTPAMETGIVLLSQKVAVA